nr:hypothetical protein [uncultured Sellimonas sp.]
MVLQEFDPSQKSSAVYRFVGCDEHPLYRGQGVDNRCLLPGDCGKGKAKTRAGMQNSGM